MEVRKITVVQTRDQKTDVINTAATTLRELKNDLNAAGINYEGMAFYEGVSKSEILSDDSPLPTNVPYRGTTTNELLFALTPNKKIESGMTRDECYQTIKERNLQQEIKDTFGRVYTSVKTTDLENFLNDFEIQNESGDTDDLILDNCHFRKMFERLLDVLTGKDIISFEIKDYILGKYDKKIKLENNLKSPYSIKDIEEMFDFMN